MIFAPAQAHINFKDNRLTHCLADFVQERGYRCHLIGGEWLEVNQAVNRRGSVPGFSLPLFDIALY